MKKLFNLYLSIFICLQAFGFEMKKVSEFALSEKYANSQSGLIFQKNNIYTLGYSGLLIFEINKKGIPVLANKIRLNGIPTTMTLHDSIIFVALQGGYDKLYKLNIEDTENAFVSDSITTKGSYLHFISDHFLYVNELSRKNTWQLAKYDFNFNLIDRIKIPYSYWALQKAGKHTFYIHKKDSLFIFSLNEGTLNREYASFYDEKTIINKIEVLEDTLMFLSSSTNLQIYNIANPMNWQLVFEFGPSDDFKITKGNIFLKSNNRIAIYDISDISNPMLCESLIIESYITSFSCNSKYLWVSTFGNELRTYRKNVDGYRFINNHPGQRRILASTLTKTHLLIETDNNKLFFWNIENIENPYIDSIEETPGYCIKILYKDSIFQRVYFDPEKKEVKQTFSILDSSSHFKKLKANSLYKGEIHRLNSNSDTLVSFYNGQMLFYEISGNDLSVFDSIEVCKAAYGEIILNDSIIFLATANKLFFLKLHNDNESIEEISNFETFIPLPNIAKYDNLIIISDRSCQNMCKFIDYSNMQFPFITRTIDETGSILLDHKDKILFIGCNNTTTFFMDKPSENKTNSNHLFQGYSTILMNYIYKLTDKKYLITVKETGVYISSFNFDS